MANVTIAALKTLEESDMINSRNQQTGWLNKEDTYWGLCSSFGAEMSKDSCELATVLQKVFAACRGPDLGDVDWRHSAMKARGPSSESIYVQLLNLPGAVAGRTPCFGGLVLRGTSSYCKDLHHPLLYPRRRRRPVHEGCQWAKSPWIVNAKIRRE